MLTGNVFTRLYQTLLRLSLSLKGTAEAAAPALLDPVVQAQLPQGAPYFFLFSLRDTALGRALYADLERHGAVDEDGPTVVVS
jgi:hypothetical protein